MARPKSTNVVEELIHELNRIEEKKEIEFPKIIESFNWLKLKQDDELKIQIIGVIPAGSDANYPFNRYKLRFEHGEQLIVNETVLKMLFSFTGIQAKLKGPSEYETFEETLIRLKGE